MTLTFDGRRFCVPKFLRYNRRRHWWSPTSCFGVTNHSEADWLGRIRLIITRAVCRLALTFFVNGRWHRLASELFDWQVRHLDIYLFCVCGLYRLIIVPVPSCFLLIPSWFCMLRTKTGCKAKPVGNPPVYPPHNLLIIVNWYACVQRSTYILSYPIAREPNPADCKAEIGLLAWSTKLVDLVYART